MKKLVTCLTAGLLVLGAQSLFAQTTTTTTTPSTATSDTPAPHKGGANAEQRKEVMKLIGLNPKDLKGLSHEDRAAKIKEAADKYIADMKAKKEAGTMTDDDKTDLAKVQKFLAAGHKKPKADTQ